MSQPHGLTDDKEPTLERPTNQEIFDKIKELLSSPAYKEALNKYSSLKRPPAVSRLSTYSYYREIFALEIKVSLDAMIESKQDIEWKYADFPSLRPSSLYQRIFQSIRYLIDHLDFDQTYLKFRANTVLSKERTGVTLRWVRDKLNGQAFLATKVTDKAKTADWKDQIEEFLVDDSKTSLHLKRLSLTTEQISDINLSFADVKNIIHFVTEKEILIRKTKDETQSNENAGQGYDS